MPWVKSWSLAKGIDQDQTAQNVQSDLDLYCPVVKSDISGTIICGTKWILFTVVERGRFSISGAERVNCASRYVSRCLPNNHVHFFFQLQLLSKHSLSLPKRRQKAMQSITPKKEN